MPFALSLTAVLCLSLGAWGCEDTPCEDACEDQQDDCKSEPPRPDAPLTCEHQYDYCLGVCANRPPEETAAAGAE